jgi:hypothetical protein
MALSLYRRHRRDCKAHHPEESRSGEFDERKENWKRCDCPIFASGTLAGEHSRQSTGHWQWDDAKAIAGQWEGAGSWDGETTVPQPIPEPEQPQRATIHKSVKSFLAELHETAAFATHKKYRLLLNKFQAFSEKRGYAMIDQWEPIDVREFRSSWAVSPQTAGRNMSMMKPFFEYCLANEWTRRNPARLVKNPRGRDTTEKRNSGRALSSIFLAFMGR